MIDYSKTKIGDILKIVEQGAPGYAQLGDLVTVESIQHNRVYVVDKNGNKAFFALTCGAARLEKVQKKCPIVGTPAEMCCDEGGFECDVEECPNEEQCG